MIGGVKDCTKCVSFLLSHQFTVSLQRRHLVDTRVLARRCRVKIVTVTAKQIASSVMRNRQKHDLVHSLPIIALITSIVVRFPLVHFPVAKTQESLSSRLWREYAFSLPRWPYLPDGVGQLSPFP